MSSLSELLPAGGGAGGTLEATASGALSNGDMVVVNSDGTVSVVAGGSVSQSLGTPVVFENGSSEYMSATYDANAQKVVISYRDVNASNLGTAVVGTVSGTSISFGTPVVFHNYFVQYTSITYDANAQKVVIAFNDGNNSNYGTAVVGTVSGTSISFGTPTVFESAATVYIASTYDSNAQKVVIAYRDNGNSYYGTAVVGTVSGTSISFGSPTVFEAANTAHIAATYDSNAQKVVIAYHDNGNSGYGTAIVGTISGTSISFGSAAVYANNGAIYYNTAIYDANAQKVVIAYKDYANSQYATAVVGAVSGSSISFGTPVVYNSADSDYHSAVYDSTAKVVVIAYQDVGNSSYGTAIVGTVSGNSISFGSEVVLENSNNNYIAITYDSNAEKVVIAYKDQDNLDYGTSIVFQPAYAYTNLTSDNFIGIADAAYSDAATATIQVAGAVDDAQTGLTAGQQYYVQTDGTLSTTADDPSVLVGTALSSTELLIKGN